MIRAKFTCIEIAKRKGHQISGSFVYVAKFTPVTSGSEENKKFYEYTPSGSIELGTITQDLFEVGKEYYVDFAPAE